VSEDPGTFRHAPPVRPLSSDLRRALLVSASVGTALVALNQGDLLVAACRGASLPPALAWKIPLTYLVPFLVSFGSSRAARRKDAGVGA
jgi:hypothetical protein